MTDSNDTTTTRDGVPSGMIKLAGESNWDKWEFRLLAKLGAAVSCTFVTTLRSALWKMQPAYQFAPLNLLNKIN